MTEIDNLLYRLLRAVEEYWKQYWIENPRVLESDIDKRFVAQFFIDNHRIDYFVRNMDKVYKLLRDLELFHMVNPMFR